MRLRIPVTAWCTSLLLSAVVLSGCGETKSASGTASIPPSTAYQPSESVSSRPITSGNLAAGTAIATETAEVLDSEIALDTAFVISRTVGDVNGSNGGLAIPANSTALLIIRETSQHGSISRVVLGLNRINVGDKAFKSGEGVKDLATVTVDQDASKGAIHRSVHLEKQSLLTFKLGKAAELR